MVAPQVAGARLTVQRAEQRFERRVRASLALGVHEHDDVVDLPGEQRHQAEVVGEAPVAVRQRRIRDGQVVVHHGEGLEGGEELDALFQQRMRLTEIEREERRGAADGDDVAERERQEPIGGRDLVAHDGVGDGAIDEWPHVGAPELRAEALPDAGVEGRQLERDQQRELVGRMRCDDRPAHDRERALGRRAQELPGAERGVAVEKRVDGGVVPRVSELRVVLLGEHRLEEDAAQEIRELTDRCHPGSGGRRAP